MEWWMQVRRMGPTSGVGDCFDLSKGPCRDLPMRFNAIDDRARGRPKDAVWRTSAERASQRTQAPARLPAEHDREDRLEEPREQPRSRAEVVRVRDEAAPLAGGLVADRRGPAVEERRAIDHLHGRDLAAREADVDGPQR